ncbi:MAG TPA: ATP-binding protein [Candidatus Edwardsbacteria bacterium]|nr:ATP-binding protein [Candidatus Edwardsbacteria bacterium]
MVPLVLAAAAVTALALGWGLMMALKQGRLRREVDALNQNLAALRESSQGQLKASSQELSRVKEKGEETRKALEAQLALLDQIINNLPAGLLVAEQDGKVLWANTGLERLTGWSIKEIAGQDWGQVFKDPLGGKEEQRAAKLQGRNTADIDQDKVYCRNGQELNVSSYLWRYAQNQRLGWLFVPKSQAIDYNRLRDEFVTNISHELRTPLTVIKGYAEILAEEAKAAGSESLEFLSVILQQSERLNGILESILNFREASTGLIGLRQEKVDLLLLVNTVIKDLEPKARAKGIAIARQVPESIAPAKGDFTALRFAFDHILDNAVKFSPQGGQVTVRVGDLKLVESTWKQEISISDNGPGIAPADLPHIFEKFYRTDQKVHTLVGTGIGLSSAKEIVENVGGTILVESAPGKGSTFTVQIPTVE